MDKEFVGQGIPFDPIDPVELDSGQKSDESQTPADAVKDIKPQKKALPILTVMLIVFMVAAFSAAAFLYFQKEDEISKRVAVEKKLEQTEADYEDLDKEYRDTLLVKRQLEVDLTQGQEKYSRIEADYKSGQAEIKDLSKKLETKMKVISSLKSNLEKETNPSTKVSTKLERVSRDYDDINGQLRQIRAAKTKKIPLN